MYSELQSPDELLVTPHGLAGSLIHPTHVYGYCCCCSVTWACSTVCNPRLTAHQASLSFTNSQNLLRFMSIESVMPSKHLILCHPLLLPDFSLSQHQGLFQRVSSSHQVAKVLEFQLQHQSFQYSGLISFRINWFDLLAVQGTLKSLLQHCSSKVSIFRCSAFFIVQHSHPIHDYWKNYSFD